MQKLGTLILLLLYILLGCTAAGEEPALSEADGQPDAADTLADSPAMATAESVEVEVTPVDEEPTAALTPEEDETVDRQTAVPVTVDLSQITPESAEPGELTVIPSPGIPEPTQRLVQEMSVDLSERLNIDVSEIEVATVEEVTWRDGSLGCPQPNMNYLQVLTPGFLVVLEAEGEQYFYHSRGTDHFILCQRGRFSMPPTDVEK